VLHILLKAVVFFLGSLISLLINKRIALS